MELVFRMAGIRNVVLWTAVIAGYVQNSMFGKGMNVFRLMIEERLQPNEVTIVSVLPACNGPVWLDSGRAVHGFSIKGGLDSFVSLMNALIAMYGKCSDLDVARYLFDGMSNRTLVSWNTMIAVYEQSGDGMKAVELFRGMIESEKNVKFNAVTLVSVISACATLGALDLSKWVHELAVSRGLETDVRVGNALTDMYSKCGNLELAREVFQAIESKGVVSWSAMIGAYATHGHAHEALELFDRMKAEGVRPNSFTYTSVLSACSHSGLVDTGMKHFESMREENGIVPKVKHCACVVDLLGRAGRLKEAYEFVKGMELKPDTGVWGALLSACRIHGNVEIAELVAEDLFKVEPHNVTFCVLMSNIYGDAGRWKDAARIRRLMKQKELKKVPGCSFIETQDDPTMCPL